VQIPNVVFFVRLLWEGLSQSLHHPLPALLQALTRYGREHHLIGPIVGIAGQQRLDNGHFPKYQEVLFADLLLSLSVWEREGALSRVQNELIGALPLVEDGLSIALFL
jgi:hypothetical protein